MIHKPSGIGDFGMSERFFDEYPLDIQVSEPQSGWVVNSIELSLKEHPCLSQTKSAILGLCARALNFS
jgi:hypothetical protein